MNPVVEPILVDEDAIRINRERWLQAADAFGDALDDAEGLENLDIDSGEEEQRDAAADGKQDDTPIVKFVNKVLIDAIKRGASDIHFEPYETDYRVRLRIDGILKQSAKMPVKLNQRISARPNVMSQLDLAQKRVPPDGRMTINLSQTTPTNLPVNNLPQP